MTDLAATDVTIALSDRDRDIGHGPLMKNITIATVTFGDGSLTYPSGGVPMPAIGNFGFRLEVQIVLPMASALDIYNYKYDATNNKLGMYDINTGAEYSGDPAARSVVLLMVGE